MDKSTTLLPVLSEKTYGQSEKGVYVVRVNKTINKTSVKRAIESQFDVKVASVNIVNVKGKAKRTISKNGRRVARGRDNDTRKAYVTLQSGHSLPFFSAIEEEEKQSEKLQEEMAKQIEKEEKPKKRSRIINKTKSKEDK